MKSFTNCCSYGVAKNFLVSWLVCSKRESLPVGVAAFIFHIFEHQLASTPNHSSDTFAIHSKATQMTHLVWERVLLVEKHTDEERGGTVVRKLRQLE